MDSKKIDKKRLRAWGTLDEPSFIPSLRTLKILTKMKMRNQLKQLEN